jgi:hypothetical protein
VAWFFSFIESHLPKNKNLQRDILISWRLGIEIFQKPFLMGSPRALKVRIEGQFLINGLSFYKSIM